MPSRTEPQTTAGQEPAPPAGPSSRHSRGSPEEEDRLSVTFAALADPTRRAILARLAEGEATVNELAAPFDLALPTVSKHLKVLQRAGLVRQGRQAQWRPCRLDPAPLAEAADWVGSYRRFWEERFDRLDAYLASLQPPRDDPAEGAASDDTDEGAATP